MKKKTRIAAIADIHVTETSQGQYRDLFIKISEDADILVICGDLTDHGYATEAAVLADELRNCTIPVVGVLGNHDYEKNEQGEILKILSNPNVTLLEGDSVVINDVGFAGCKGFAGGFDTFMLAPWGESTVKNFVQEAVDDVMKLEKGLMRLDNIKTKIVLLHYSPIRSTVEGEPEQLFPFLGCSRLSDPINRFDATAVFHGHAHHGSPEGQTRKGIPVFNVSVPVLQRMDPPLQYRIFEV